MTGYINFTLTCHLCICAWHTCASTPVCIKHTVRIAAHTHPGPSLTKLNPESCLSSCKVSIIIKGAVTNIWYAYNPLWYETLLCSSLQMALMCPISTSLNSPSLNNTLRCIEPNCHDSCKPHTQGTHSSATIATTLDSSYYPV